MDPIPKLNGFQESLETVPLTAASLLNDPLFHFSSYNAIAHTYNSFQPPPPLSITLSSRLLIVYTYICPKARPTEGE
jgi:hypothetical protein